MTRRGRLAALAFASFACAFAFARFWPSRSTLGSILDAAPPDLSRFDAALDFAAAESGVDGSLLRGLVASESGGNPRARSSAGALGLAQLMPDTASLEAKSLRIADPPDLLDPAVNLRLGARHLARLLNDFRGDEALALAAYNAGKAPALRWRLRAVDVGGAGAVAREGYAATRHYVVRVAKLRDAYRSRASGVPGR